QKPNPPNESEGQKPNPPNESEGQKPNPPNESEGQKPNPPNESEDLNSSMTSGALTVVMAQFSHISLLFSLLAKF
ncbi:unnamed protein product, partial [Dibothriocephalus latus]